MTENPGHETPMADSAQEREALYSGAASLWIREPESQREDRTLLAARLCGCSDVCQANIEDR